MNRAQALIEHHVPDRPRRGLPVLASVEQARSDLDPGAGQDLANRLDSVLVTVIVDEAVDIGQRRSSPAWEK